MRHYFKKLLFMLLTVSGYAALQAGMVGCCGNNNTCSTTICERTNFTGHTFFTVRPQFQQAMPELITMFRGDRTRRKCDGIGGAFEFTVFGGKSTDSDKLAQYFMPFGKTQLLAGELGSNAVQTHKADLIANYFGVMTANPNTTPTAGGFNDTSMTFESLISFRPKQSVFGLGLAWRQSFAGDCDQGWYMMISTPIERVQNYVNFSETIVNAGGGATLTGFVNNMTAAFCGQPVLNFALTGTAAPLIFPGGGNAFQYGKIDCNGSNCSSNTSFTTLNSGTFGCCDGATSGSCNSRIKWGLADIQVNVGYEWFADEDAYSDLWAGIVIPTGNRPQGVYIWEPIVGNNKHFAVAVGGTYAYELWKSCDGCERSIWVDLNMTGRYYAPNTQRRSFDLIDKQWSRYMWVYPSNTATPMAGIQPGINYFTQEMRVSPRFDRDINGAFMYRSERCEAEIGYNFYARSGEDVRLCNPAAINGIGLVGFDVTNVAGPVRTASHTNQRSFSDIQTEQVFDSNAAFNGSTTPLFLPLSENDINYASAAAPCTLTHTFYASVGKTWENCEYPTFAGLGGSYEFSADNSGLDRWLVWFKVGFSY